jgi:hypothetical protein
VYCIATEQSSTGLPAEGGLQPVCTLEMPKINCAQTKVCATGGVAPIVLEYQR